MKTKLKHNNLLWTVCLGACLPFAAAHAAPQYSVVDLGSLGGIYSVGLGVNNSGLVSGFSYLPGDSSEHAINGDGLTSPQDLGTLGGIYSQAYSINNLGNMVGSASLTGDSGYHAFQLNSGAVPPLAALKDLNALVVSGDSRAFSINDKDQVTGFSTTADATEHAVIWQTDNTITDLGTLDGTGNSQGLAINAAGQVAGFSSLTGNKATHAVLWAADGAKTDLGTLGGTHSAAYGLNAQGDVAGSATTTLDAQHAFLWQSTSVPPMSDLGTLGGTFSEAHGISSLGEVVGNSTTLNNAAQKAFLWQSGSGLKDLNTLIDPLSGWTLLEAQAISDDGRYITGVGIFTGAGIAGERHAFLLKKLVSDATPPVIKYTLTPAAPGVTGWYVAAPSLVWSVTDPETAVTSKVGCVNATVTDTAGQTFSCVATSTGGTAVPVTTPAIKVDTVAPVLANVPANFTQQASSLNGASVTYALPTASDTLSGVSGAVSCLPASGAIFAVGATTVNCSAKDTAGNNASGSFVVTVADQTPPVITPTLTGTVGANGWFTSPVSVAWSAVDNESAITSTPCPSATITTNGTNPANTCAATSAGGVASANTAAIKIDTVAPVFGSCPATVALTQGQALSQPTATDAQGAAVVTGAPASLVTGTTAVTWKATDQAGLSSTCSQLVTVTAPPVVITETIRISKAQCKKVSATSGQWSVQGSSTILTGNTIQLYATSTVPANLAASKLGAAPVAKGAWLFQNPVGPACTSPISLRSSATGKVLENIAVLVR